MREVCYALILANVVAVILFVHHSGHAAPCSRWSATPANSTADPFDDPTTALQALDRLHDLLRQLITRRFPSVRHTDGEGRLRLWLPARTRRGFR
jgi:hypothetical protein